MVPKPSLVKQLSPLKFLDGFLPLLITFIFTAARA
jgi:hypothetical protein